MKILTLILPLVSLSAFAQTSIGEIAENPNKAGGVYYAYPVTEAVSTPAPKGYEPFYISHYGRHGSRYLISESDYTRVAEVLHKAAEDGQLTPLGIDVMNRLDSVIPEALKRGGDLTPLGVRQHRAIAERMYRNYPQVFKGSPELSARSTTVIRCILSMDAFCERLKELNPAIRTTRESSDRYMNYLNYHSDESNRYTSGDWKIEYENFVESKVDPTRQMGILFKDGEYVKKKIRSKELFWGLYWIAVDMQNMETAISFYDIFTPEELYSLWECGNYHNYVCDANYAGNKGLVVGNASNLLNNIIETADKAIESGENSITLRFGHDGNLMPLAAILGMENADSSVSDPNEIASVWSNFKISPMAGNVQMIFYRPKERAGKKHQTEGAKPILVKFLLNEKETAIDLPTDNFPYYDWQKVKSHYKETKLRKEQE